MALISLSGTNIALSNIEKVSAQMMDMGGPMAESTGNNMTSIQVDNGTISIKSTIFNAISSKVNVSLSQAVETAEQSFGNNNSRGVMGQLEEINGYLVYLVCIFSHNPQMKLTHVFVDPGSGNILGTQEATMIEAMRMHGGMMTMDVNEYGNSYSHGGTRMSKP